MPFSGIHPAKPDRYRADYGLLGSIDFMVT